MGDRKRWNVTYTKHVKQKRKVYQDGFLELQSSGPKVILYDEFEKLLECRFVKKDDVIVSGETLEFASHLVDIGDPYADAKLTPSLSFQEKDEKVLKKPRSLLSNKFVHHSTSADREINFGKKARVINLSPSQKMIREYKKSETSKYCISPSRSDTTKSITREWQVLYTTQITQKAKKFHDGFLQLIVCGSQGSQVLLYDTSRRLLDSRFLKRDEIVSSGESLGFDSHLVDIGEPEGDGNPHKDLAPERLNCEAVGKTERSQSKIPTSGKLPAEWQVLYTTQITQKAKKFHDGFLQLIACGSQGRQVMLYDATRRLLEGRFIKRDEIVSSGKSLVLGIYLVDIGKCEKDKKPPKDLAIPGIDLEAGVKTETYNQANSIIGKFHAGTCMDINGKSSKTYDAKLSWMVPADKPRRAAHEILSNLRKLTSPENIVAVKRALVEENNDSQSPHVHSNITNKLHGQVNESKLKELNVKTISDHDCNTRNLKTQAVSELLPIGSIKDGAHDKRRESRPRSPGLNLSSRVDRSNTNLEIESSPQLVSHKENRTRIIPSATVLCSSQQKMREDSRGTIEECRAEVPYVGASNASIAGDSSKEFNTIEMDEFPSFDLGI